MLVELLGMRPESAAGASRACHVSRERLEALLADPELVGLLLRELNQGDTLSSPSPAEQMAQLRRLAIRCSLSADSPYFGLSVEEIVVMTAYRSPLFDGTPWKRFLVRPYTAEELMLAGRRWLREAGLVPDEALPPWRRWLMARSPGTQRKVALTFALEARRLRHELGWLATEVDLAHETYVVCSLPTALAFIDTEAKTSRSERVHARALEHPLRALGLGLLLVDLEETFVALPARYRDVPQPCRT